MKILIDDKKLAQRLLDIADEKKDPGSCLHLFATCEECGSRINIMALANAINKQSQQKEEKQ